MDGPLNTARYSGWDLVEVTDTGERARNEDFVRHLVHPEDSGLLMAIVADGMGGQEGGFQASRIAVDTAARVFVTHGRTADPRQLLDQAGQAAHQALRDLAAANPAFSKAGTTLVMMLARGDTVFHAHVGDSRLYLLRAGVFRQLTQDHSLVRLLIERGELAPEAAETDERRHILSQAVGNKTPIKVEVLGPVKALPNDLFFLCSDGLYSVIPDAETHVALAEKSPKEAARWLVEETLRRGAHDNITIQILTRTGPGGAARPLPPGAAETAAVNATAVRSARREPASGAKPSGGKAPLPVLIGGALLIVILVALIVWALKGDGDGDGSDVEVLPPLSDAAEPDVVAEPSPEAPPAEPGTEVTAISGNTPEQLEALKNKEDSDRKAAAAKAAKATKKKTKEELEAEWSGSVARVAELGDALSADIAEAVRKLELSRTTATQQHKEAERKPGVLLGSGEAKPLFGFLGTNKDAVVTLKAEADGDVAGLRKRSQQVGRKLARISSASNHDDAALLDVEGEYNEIRTSPEFQSLQSKASKASDLAAESEAALSKIEKLGTLGGGL